MVDHRTGQEVRALLLSVAVVWLATGLLVLHPLYRAIGSTWLGRAGGLPDSVMWLTCAAEVALGLRVALGEPSTWVTALQTAMVAGFTVILGFADPSLLVHPVGVLMKNLPLVAALWAAWLVAREGWTDRAQWLLRWGMAVIWVTEGLFPKILFQTPWELSIVVGSGLVPIDAALFLKLMGLAQIASGVAALLLRGRALRVLLGCQVAALVALPLLVSWQDPALWLHPFGPLTKNAPIVVGTWLVMRRCSTSS